MIHKVPVTMHQETLLRELGEVEEGKKRPPMPFWLDGLALAFVVRSIFLPLPFYYSSTLLFITFVYYASPRHFCSCGRLALSFSSLIDSFFYFVKNSN